MSVSVAFSSSSKLSHNRKVVLYSFLHFAVFLKNFVWGTNLNSNFCVTVHDTNIKVLLFYFSVHLISGSVDLLLFQPETTEEQFHFYLQIVDGRLEDYKECFDWLLSAEEFHRESDWLECMRNHAVEISDVQHALKMIDIIYMQRQFLCADDKSSDTVYREMKEVNYVLYSGYTH